MKLSKWQIIKCKFSNKKRATYYGFKRRKFFATGHLFMLVNNLQYSTFDKSIKNL